jgi:probable addiction module antidote protein
MKKNQKSVPYEASLDERLKDPEYAIEYLTQSFALDKDNDGTFLVALGDVARTHGVGKIANQADLSRDAIYKALSKEGNPTYSTLRAIFDELGIEIEFTLKQKTG